MSIARTFDPSLVTLPRLGVAGAVTLGAQILKAAEGGVPAPVETVRDDLREAHGALHAAQVAQVPLPDADSVATRDVDRANDQAWSALNTMLLGASRVPGRPALNAAANRILAAVFPGGLDFTQFKFVHQWAESESRLKRITELGLESDFATLGITYALEAVRETHAPYSAMLGISERRPSPPMTPSLAEPLGTFTDLLREYVLKVTATVDRRRPETQRVADDLLAPLRAWQSASATRGAGEAPREPAPGGTPA